MLKSSKAKDSHLPLLDRISIHRKSIKCLIDYIKLPSYDILLHFLFQLIFLCYLLSVCRDFKVPILSQYEKKGFFLKNRTCILPLGLKLSLSNHTLFIWIVLLSGAIQKFIVSEKILLCGMAIWTAYNHYRQSTNSLCFYSYTCFASY